MISLKIRSLFVFLSFATTTASHCECKLYRVVDDCNGQVECGSRCCDGEHPIVCDSDLFHGMANIDIQEHRACNDDYDKKINKAIEQLKQMREEPEKDPETRYLRRGEWLRIDLRVISSIAIRCILIHYESCKDDCSWSMVYYFFLLVRHFCSLGTALSIFRWTHLWQQFFGFERTKQYFNDH